MDKTAFSAPGAAAPLGAYSDAIDAAGLIFMTAQVGLDADGNVVGDTAVEQARQAFENLRQLLSAAGLTTDAVVKCTLYLTDMNDRLAINEIYKEYFRAPYPTRDVIQVVALAEGLKFEISAIAAKG
jgi:2-iminobutanoate/2-iminopropanoate deaminase